MSIFKGISNYWKLVFLILAFHTIAFQAQIENTPISKEVTMDRLYGGLLSNTNLTNTDNHQTYSSVQFGARLHMQLIPEIVRIRTFGVFKRTEGQSKQFFKSYEAILTPTKKASIHLGVMATPTTELRQNPTTWQSQVETYAEKTIIGGRPGIKLSCQLNENFALGYGLHNHDGRLGQHLKITYRQFDFASFVEQQNMFFAAKWTFAPGHLLVTASKDKMAFSTIIPIKTVYSIYFDSDYNSSARKPDRMALGFRKHFPDDGLIKGFLSISYGAQAKRIQGGFFIHI